MVLAVVVAVMSLTMIFTALVLIMECRKRAADVVLVPGQFAASKVRRSHPETSHQVVEGRASGVSNLLRAVKDVFGAIKKHARLLHEPKA
ncbi:MAG: hypothetical protein M3P26_02460 [Gemmatimonadota bacterium]|nr:hypothetical protein [Gemmatimonadota bacterium]